ncbi:trimeric intracellular cation channel type B [Suncus etruscus]|uniref:trimeric intracellular cation channel type B n=1 Tax=Suncus etruscus TaxID=109475 RepID=UPI0021104651|nr:trimeric intracellular cation channel type B [Suncus etruscus]
MGSPWEDLTLAFSRTPMYPFFDIAHYLVSVMALKRQPGAAAEAWRNPMSSWFSAMLHCFGGGILSCILLAEPPVRFLSNNTNILLASSIWYIVFFCPHDLVSQGYSFLPVQLLAAGMKEVTRTWKIIAGVTHANNYYKNGWIIMIAIGWARGAGGSIVTNFELLMKGAWKPEADEWLKMSYPAKITLLGSVVFTFQHAKYLPIARHNLMFLYTIFIVATKITMMITDTSAISLAPLEDVLSRIFFGMPRFLCEKKDEKKTEEKSQRKLSANGTDLSTQDPKNTLGDVKKKDKKKDE